MAKETGWAVVGRHGLYVDWRRTRRSIIAQHVSDLWSGRSGFGDISSHVWGNKLDEKQAKAWKLCRRNGDRVVKVTIAWRG